MLPSFLVNHPASGYETPKIVWRERLTDSPHTLHVTATTFAHLSVGQSVQDLQWCSASLPDSFTVVLLCNPQMYSDAHSTMKQFKQLQQTLHLAVT